LKIENWSLVHNPMGFGFGFTLKVVQGQPKQMVVDEKLT
jgi:hypothetical protein